VNAETVTHTIGDRREQRGIHQRGAKSEQQHRGSPHEEAVRDEDAQDAPSLKPHAAHDHALATQGGPTGRRCQAVRYPRRPGTSPPGSPRRARPATRPDSRRTRSGP